MPKNAASSTNQKVIARTTDHFDPHFDRSTADASALQFREAAFELLVHLRSQGYYACLVEADTFDGDRTFARHYLPTTDCNYETRGSITVDALYDKTYLCATHIPSITDQRFSVISRDKFATYQLFPDFQPYTVQVKQPADFPAALEHFSQHLQLSTDDLIVLKPVTDFGGNGIHIATAAHLARLVQSDSSIKYPLVLQEFIESSAGVPGLVSGRHDLRVVMLNGEILGGSIRQPRPGGLLSNTHQGGTITTLERTQLPQSVIELTQSIDRQLPAVPRFYSADFFYSAARDRWYLVELNESPGFMPSSFGEVGILMQQKLAAALIELAKTAPTEA